MNTKELNRAIITTCLLGVLVSTYAFHVEMVAEVQPGYSAMCDIGKYASCSKVLTSAYSKGFGLASDDSSLKIPNCIFGIIFYCLMIFLSTFDHSLVARLQFFIALTSVVGCVYLAYLLAFVLYDFCIVCVSTYIINGFLVYFTWKKTDGFTLKNK